MYRFTLFHHYAHLGIRIRTLGTHVRQYIRTHEPCTDHDDCCITIYSINSIYQVGHKTGTQVKNTRHKTLLPNTLFRGCGTLIPDPTRT